VGRIKMPASMVGGDQAPELRDQGGGVNSPRSAILA
jgi:hypothetical protein